MSQPSRPGRQRLTTVDEIGRAATELFIQRGFESTTVGDIAAAAGIGRRTFFRYFASKNDVPWGDYDARLEHMREVLEATPADVDLLDALLAGVRDFNTYTAEQLTYHRERARLLMTVPSLVAHSSLRFAAWRQVVAEFAASRLGVPASDLQPQMLAWAFLSVAMTAYEQWLLDDDADLLALLDESLAALQASFA